MLVDLKSNQICSIIHQTRSKLLKAAAKDKLGQILFLPSLQKKLGQTTIKIKNLCNQFYAKHKQAFERETKQLWCLSKSLLGRLTEKCQITETLMLIK